MALESTGLSFPPSPTMVNVTTPVPVLVPAAVIVAVDVVPLVIVHKDVSSVYE